MKPLTMLMVEASKQACVPDGLAFRWTAHHVKEIFVLLLPHRLILDGSTKVQITCGPRGMESHYYQVLGTSNIHVEDFDFNEYAMTTPEVKENTVLCVIEHALKEIAAMHGTDPRPIENAAASVRACGFNMTTEIKKLETPLPDGSGCIIVLRDLSRDSGETWRVRVLDNGRCVLGEKVLGETPHYMDMRQAYRSSRMEGKEFVVVDRFGKVLTRIDLGDVV